MHDTLFVDPIIAPEFPTTPNLRPLRAPGASSSSSSMPRKTRSQTKKSSSNPISPSQPQPEESTSGPSSVTQPLPPPTTTRNLRPRALRGSSRPPSVLSSASSASSTSAAAAAASPRRGRGRGRGRGGSRSSNWSRDSSVLSSALGDSDGRSPTIVEATTPRGYKRRKAEVPSPIPESNTGRSDQPTDREPESTGPPRPDWRNWEEYDNEEGLDQLREDDEEESQVARHLEQTTSSSSQIGTPRQDHSERSIPSSNTMASSSPLAVAVVNPCSPVPINATTTLGSSSAVTHPSTTATTTVDNEMNHPSSSSSSSLSNRGPGPTLPLNTSPSSSPWHITQTHASPVTSASLQKIINDVNVEPNVTGRRSTMTTTTTTTALTSPPPAPLPPPTTSNTNIKRKRDDSSSDIEIVEISSFPPPTKKRDKGKGKARAFSISPSSPSQPPIESTTTTPPQTQQSQNQEESLSEYTCPICFFPPSNATLTPCGHVCCGSCLFTAIKTTLQRGLSMGMMIGTGENVARCPVCRAAIPGWDGKGGGVIGIKVRQIISL